MFRISIIRAAGIIRAVNRHAAVFASAGSLVLLASIGAAQTARLNTAGAADLAAGRRIFEAQCAWCHGTDGDGRNRTRPAPPDAASRGQRSQSLVEIIRNGIPGTDMPSFASR